LYKYSSGFTLINACWDMENGERWRDGVEEQTLADGFLLVDI
jgi:hypothetical protein